MSAVPHAMTPQLGGLDLMPMRIDDIEQIMVIENSVYPHPWTRGNFLDSLYSRYETAVLRDTTYDVMGYYLVMLAVDEAHLLNITVRRDLHGKGYGRLLLDNMVAMARDKAMSSVLLEVRPSNARALAIYEHYGFSRIGQRKGYYPADGNTREDAIVMRLPI